MKKIYLILTIVAAIAVLAGGIYWFGSKKQGVDFVPQAPSVLPNGVEVTSRQFDRWHPTDIRPVYVEMITNVTPNDFFIGQYNAKNFEDALKCDQKTNKTCEIKSTKKGTPYKADSSDGLIAFYKDDSYFWIRIQSNVDTYADYDWGSVIDSFKPVEVPDITIKDKRAP